MDSVCISKVCENMKEDNDEAQGMNEESYDAKTHFFGHECSTNIG